MGSVIGVDTGRSSAWGWARDGQLVACGLFEVMEGKRLVLPEVRGATCFVEYPRDYPGEKRKVDPNDLIKLALRAGRAYEALISWGNTVHLVYPRDWKGGAIPKDISHQRIKADLTREEHRVLQAYMAPVSPGLRHNVWDAIGITLYGAIKVGDRKA